MQEKLRIPKEYTRQELSAYLKGAEQLRQLCLRGLGRELEELGWNHSMMYDLFEKVGIHHEILFLLPDDFQPID
jgi:hypothetical protein